MPVRTGLSVVDGGCHRVPVRTGLSGDDGWRRAKRRQGLGEKSCLASGRSFPEKGEVWRSVYEELIAIVS